MVFVSFVFTIIWDNTFAFSTFLPRHIKSDRILSAKMSIYFTSFLSALLSPSDLSDFYWSCNSTVAFNDSFNKSLCLSSLRTMLPVSEVMTYSRTTSSTISLSSSWRFMSNNFYTSDQVLVNLSPNLRTHRMGLSLSKICIMWLWSWEKNWMNRS